MGQIKLKVLNNKTSYLLEIKKPMSKLTSLWLSIPANIRKTVKTGLWIGISAFAMYILGILSKMPQLVLFSPLLNFVAVAINNYANKEEQ